MIQLHFCAKQLKIDKTMGVLHSFVQNYVKYSNTEDFRKNSHIIMLLYFMQVLIVSLTFYYCNA